MKKELSKHPLTTKEFIIMVVMGLAIWRVPLWVFDLGAILAGLLPVLGFTIGYGVVMLIRRIKQK